VRGLDSRLGRIYLDFGKPIPLHDRLTSLRADGLDNRQVVERVALEICHRINRTTPVSATAAVCVAMLGADRALTLDEVCATVAPLARYLNRRGWPMAGAATLTDRATVRRTLQELVGSGVLTCYDDGSATVWGIGPDQHLIAAVYRNSAVHVLLVRAIGELALLSIVRTPGSTARTGWEEALALRELLKFDFFFAAREEFADELWDEVAIIADDRFERGAEISPVDAQEWLSRASPLIAHLVLRPFIDAYRVVAEQLVALDAEAEFDEERFIDQCLRLGTQWALQRRVASEESVSGEMFRTALKMARHRGLVDGPDAGADLTRHRGELADEIMQLQESIADLSTVDKQP
jgi:glycerol-3-phosphate O-acyltransferase